MNPRTPLYGLMAAAGLLLAYPALAAPAVTHWTLTDLGDLAGGTDSSYATGINNAGQVVGGSSSASGDQGFIWQNGAMSALGGDMPTGTTYSNAQDINNLGQVVGWRQDASGNHGYLWQGGAVIDLGDLPGGQNSSMAYAINDARQVVGDSGVAGTTHAFLWQGGSLLDLGDLPGGGTSVMPRPSITRARWWAMASGRAGCMPFCGGTERYSILGT